MQDMIHSICIPTTTSSVPNQEPGGDETDIEAVEHSFEDDDGEAWQAEGV